MTTTGGNPVISSRHSADAEPAADPRFAQPAAFSAPPRRGAEPPLDYPETPGYTDPQGRSARYPMAEPTYVPGRPYEGESRYGADPSYDEPTSYAGAPKHPAWYHNLVANPDTTVQIGSEKRLVHARVATAEERERLWPKAVKSYRGYEDYQARSRGREIPLVILEPRK